MSERPSPEDAAEVERILSGAQPEIDFAENERLIVDAEATAKRERDGGPEDRAAADVILKRNADAASKPLGHSLQERLNAWWDAKDKA